jgi:hypothetical protein
MAKKSAAIKKNNAQFGTVFGVVGGILIILAGIAVIIYGGNILSLTSGTFGISRYAFNTSQIGLFLPMGLFGMLTGIIIIISSMALHYTDKNKSFWSTLILFFAVLSLTNAAGGFFIGFFMALFCGIIGLSRG